MLPDVQTDLHGSGFEEPEIYSKTRCGKDYLAATSAEYPRTKSNVKCLQNHQRAVFRLRVGNYRVLFNRYNEFEVLEIIDVGHRKELY